MTPRFPATSPAEIRALTSTVPMLRQSVGARVKKPPFHASAQIRVAHKGFLHRA
jgi:hypothetical protein